MNAIHLPFIHTSRKTDITMCICIKKRDMSQRGRPGREYLGAFIITVLRPRARRLLFDGGVDLSCCCAAVLRFVLLHHVNSQRQRNKLVRRTSTGMVVFTVMVCILNETHTRHKTLQVTRTASILGLHVLTHTPTNLFPFLLFLHLCVYLVRTRVRPHTTLMSPFLTYNMRTNVYE